MQNDIDDGQLLFINSMSGHRVVWSKTGHFYTATKFAVTGLLEGFRQEVNVIITLHKIPTKRKANNN